jgi:NADH-quinone oxidoreductase subunit L
MTPVRSPLLFLIPFLPLLGAMCAGLFGIRLQRRWGERAINIPTVAMPWISFLIVAVSFVQLVQAGPEAYLHQHLWTWFDIGPFKVDVAFTFDRLSAVMCTVVTFIGSLIHVYSTGYMKGDPSYFRFFSYLNLFLFSMLVLVLGDSLIMVFVGWEGVGLCSYLLISFWYTDVEKAKAGMKAFVTNRVGDAGFLLGVGLLFWSLQLSASHPAVVTDAAVGAVATAPMDPGATPAEAHAVVAGEHEHAAAATLPSTSLKFRELEQIITDPVRSQGLAAERWLGISATTLACLLLFLAATGKSAQLPLHVWLPDAMAGPTPVSALIHAATMVTAGVYLIARMHFLFAQTPVAMTVVATVGALTALFAATIGLFQHDIKKVLAYSTVSQLGFMFVALGAGAWWVAVFHLMTHAFFKACLFLGSGSVIVGCHHEQDMRRMGGLSKLMPVTALTYLVSCCAIAGFPLFSGFFSKDEILWQIFDTGNVLLPGGGLVPWVLATVSATCTSFYVFRSYYMTFSGSYRGGHERDAHGAAADHDSHHVSQVPQESPRTMTIPLIVLGSLAAMGGLVGLPKLWHLPNAFESWLEPLFESSQHYLRSAEKGHSAEWGLMGLSVVLAITGFGIAYWLYKDAKNPIPGKLFASQSPVVRGVHRLIYNKYYIDELYGVVVIRRVVDLSRILSWTDGRLVDGLVNSVGWIGRQCGNLQGFIDRVLVDGMVNLVGDSIVGAGRSLRTLQTGRIQTYIVALLTGSVLLVLAIHSFSW